mgnify:FL=1
MRKKERMTTSELIQKLKDITTSDEYAPSDGHEKMDKVLLDYIGDDEVSEIFHSAEKWYD